ncbi:MAG: sigma-70 family RNA polymerase sigma factor [Planctomycetota bacterium]
MAALLPETRHSLIARLARPEDSATWSEFLCTYESAILRFCRARGLQEADVADVAQEVLLAVHSVAPRWQPTHQSGSFRAWLFETARRSCLHAMRKRRRATEDLHEDAVSEGASDVLAQLADEEQNSWEQWAFCAAASVVQNEVETSTWQAFWLTAVENLPASEAAARLHLTMGNVYTAKSRVLGRLRRCAGELSMSDRSNIQTNLDSSPITGEHRDTDL